ncbi:hypothetical protein CVT26_012374 [Gymnopilus dilepis]|uniref:Uncharacterized protein n=1 Tax=Gymnopilus dilepis TaxID=231916 RepID=A0A409WAR1_9AGAR|nr:hypothetical protein CVT26_012374 [Gymnopilus dilepis]
MYQYKSGFEKDLINEQLHADNLTSFQPYPFPGRLVEIPYPLSEQGRPLSPRQLLEYCHSRRFELPSCFHGRPSKLVVKEASEHTDGYVTLECNVHNAESVPCPFFINLSALLRDDDDYMEFRLYSRRCEPPSPPRLREIFVLNDDQQYNSNISSSSESYSESDMSISDAESTTSTQFLPSTGNQKLSNGFASDDGADADGSEQGHSS